MNKVQEALKAAETFIGDLPFSLQRDIELRRLQEALVELKKCEPVGEVGYFNGELVGYLRSDIEILPDTKVYTSPISKEWVGLSDEDVLKILDECAVSPYTNKQSAFGYVKAIEAKLKELNT